MSLLVPLSIILPTYTYFVSSKKNIGIFFIEKIENTSTSTYLYFYYFYFYKSLVIICVFVEFVDQLDKLKKKLKKWTCHD